ncbi:Fic/DOC family protein [Metamycoplasma subdolum]|uniref:Fic/DOC family protein n=1 Tax=Metamycoplasma subdolum TaxID=92407 RepID=A0A3M0A3Z4_9BACT|nr:Fic family protein [Metamycoplasma subdolum]RMA77468.1 Fic/DOC family protein [Metamycoplasma subdolum]WPB50667.1 Fic family protein [Metamycoplasma subdolum]
MTEKFSIWLLNDDNLENLKEKYLTSFAFKGLEKTENNLNTNELQFLFEGKTILVSFDKLDYEEISQATVPSIVTLAFSHAKLLSDEPIDEDNQTKEKVQNLLLLRLNNFFSYIHNNDAYSKFTQFDVFYLVSYIIEGFIRNHLLINGNKRITFTLLLSLLLTFTNLNIKLDSNKKMTSSSIKYANEIIKFVELAHDKNNSDDILDNPVIEAILKFIFENFIINIDKI